MLTLPVQLYKFRRSKGISQERLAQLSGVPLSRIRGLENGCPHTEDDLIKILSVLNIDIRWQDDTRQKCELVQLQPIKPLRSPIDRANASTLTMMNTEAEARYLAELNIVKAYFDKNYPPLEQNSNNAQRVILRRLNQQIVDAQAALHNKISKLESE